MLKTQFLVLGVPKLVLCEIDPWAARQEIEISLPSGVLKVRQLGPLVGSQRFQKTSNFFLLASEIRPKQVQAKYFKTILLLLWSIPLSQLCKLDICGMKKLM